MSLVRDLRLVVRLWRVLRELLEVLEELKKARKAARRQTPGNPFVVNLDKDEFGDN
jgi:hypothetical protein